MHLADGRRDTDSKAQESLNSHRRTQKLAKQLASRVFEYQNSLAVFRHEFERPERPTRVEVFRQLVFVSKSVEAAGRWALRGGEHSDRCTRVAIATLAPDPAQKNVAFPGQHLDYAAVFGRFEPHRFRSLVLRTCLCLLGSVYSEIAGRRKAARRAQGGPFDQQKMTFSLSQPLQWTESDRLSQKAF